MRETEPHRSYGNRQPKFGELAQVILTLKSRAICTSNKWKSSRPVIVLFMLQGCACEERSNNSELSLNVCRIS